MGPPCTTLIALSPPPYASRRRVEGALRASRHAIVRFYLSCLYANRTSRRLVRRRSHAASFLAAGTMALSQKEVRLADARLADPPTKPGVAPRAYAALPRSARAAQADIQMMLAAQCHLGTKCAPEPCFLAQP